MQWEKIRLQKTGSIPGIGLIGLLPLPLVERIDAMLMALSLPLTHSALEAPDRLLQGLEDFRQHLGGALSIPLLHNIGEPFDLDTIELDAMREAIASRAALPS